MITENLGAALRNFRLKERPRVLWADAVCINQADDEERGCQVQMMGKTYGKAGRTLVWLGDESEDSGRAINVLEVSLFQSMIKRMASSLARMKIEHDWSVSGTFCDVHGFLEDGLYGSCST